MADFTPAQSRAIDNLGANIAVTAGAGAGKTKVLVERYLNILRRRVAGCSEILAITFTNKAAKEMKERINAKINELALDNDAGERRFWRHIKAELENAPIGTFHSFCARVLRENPVEAGLDPNFTVLDEVDNTIVMDKILTEVLDAAINDATGRLDNFLAAYGQKEIAANLPALYDKFASLGLLADSAALQLTYPYLSCLEKEPGMKQGLKQLCRELIGQSAEFNPKTAMYGKVDNLKRNWNEVAAAIEAAGTGDEACYDIMHKFLDGLDRRSKCKEIVAEIKEALSELDSMRADRLALDIVPGWQQLLLALDEAVTKYQRQNQALTFSSLEVRCARLLREHPAVLDKYGARYKQIMVDEFQDTNELQKQIVYLLAGGDQAVLKGNKLFVVGDPKQSIYRFRGADVNLFDQVSRDVEASGGQVLELDINFRSMDGLLSLYNEYFSIIMSTEDDSVIFQPLRAHRAEADAGRIRAELLVIAKQELAEGISPRDAEALAVAARIKAMVAGREELIGHDTTARAVSYGDIAILFRAAGDIESYAAALQRAGVPYYIVGGKGFYDCQEVRDILNLLKVVDNKFRQTALAAVLKSPLFGIADQSLATLKMQGGLWEGLQAASAVGGLSPEQRRAAERAGQIITKLRNLRGVIGVAELVELALQETNYLYILLTQFMGRQKYANVIKLAALARKFETKAALSLNGFLRYVAKLTESEVKEGEAVIESEAGDTVKLMTIHKAKGLEFPVVFLPDLHRKFNDETAPVLFSAGGGLGIKVPLNNKMARTSHYNKLQAEEKLLAQLELKRLFYVALTRAKDYVVLSGAGDKIAAGKSIKEQDSWLKWLGSVCGLSDLNELPDKITVRQSEIMVRNFAAATTNNQPAPDFAPGQASLPELAKIIRNVGPVDYQQGNKRVFSASKIAKFRRCARAFYYDFVAGLPELAEDAKGYGGGRLPAALTGTVLHRCLEILNDETGWVTAVEQAAEEKTPPEWRDAVAAEASGLLNRYLGSSFYRKYKGRPSYREWQFNYFLPGPVGEVHHFTGSVDCLVDYGTEGFGIIDYKTDKVEAGKAVEKAQGYTLQLLLYAMATEEIWKRPVKEACFYFWRPDVAVPVSITEAAKQAAAGELLSVCSFVASHDTESDYDCNLKWCDTCGYRTICPRV